MTSLTAAERAEAKRLCDRMLAQSCGDGACHWTRPTGMGTNGGCRCTTYVRSTAFPTAVRALVRALADLEAVERERDEARADSGDGLVIGEMLLATERKRVADAIAERDTARAHVERLKQTLRAISRSPDWYECRTLAKDALKAAGLTADGSQEASGGAPPTT